MRFPLLAAMMELQTAGTATFVITTTCPMPAHPPALLPCSPRASARRSARSPRHSPRAALDGSCSPRSPRHKTPSRFGGGAAAGGQKPSASPPQLSSPLQVRADGALLPWGLCAVSWGWSGAAGSILACRQHAPRPARFLSYFLPALPCPLPSCLPCPAPSSHACLLSALLPWHRARRWQRCTMRWRPIPSSSSSRWDRPCNHPTAGTQHAGLSHTAVTALLHRCCCAAVRCQPSSAVPPSLPPRSAADWGAAEREQYAAP